MKTMWIISVFIFTQNEGGSLESFPLPFGDSNCWNLSSFQKKITFGFIMYRIYVKIQV